MPFYKDAKQNLGLDEYELRKIRGVSRHLHMILVAHTLLSLGSVDRAAGKAMVYLETIGSACRRGQNPRGAVLVEEATRENGGV